MKGKKGGIDVLLSDTALGIKVEVHLKKPYFHEETSRRRFLPNLGAFFSKKNSEKEAVLPAPTEGAEDPKVYYSKVIDIREAHRLVVIYPPVAKMLTLALREKDLIAIHYVLKNRGRYIAEATVAETDENSVTVKLTGDEIRIQERAFYRVEIFARVKAVLLESKPTEVQIYDISYSGAKIRIREDAALQPGDVFLMEVPTKDIIRLVSCEVVRVAGERIYGVRFLDLSAEEQVLLEHYIKEQERMYSEELSERIYKR